MSLRYEVTPGFGLIARHGDSVLWVGDPVSREIWDALRDGLDLEPGTAENGADTLESLRALEQLLRTQPAAVFAALIIKEGRGQGILRGPVTIRNATAVAPATGFEQFGITVPFPISHSVYAGFHQVSGNPPRVSEVLDLDAGIVPGGGAWVHPVAQGADLLESTARFDTESAAREESGADPLSDAGPSADETPIAAPPADEPAPATATADPSVDAPPDAAPARTLPPVDSATGSWAASIAAKPMSAASDKQEFHRVDLRSVEPHTGAPLPSLAAAGQQPSAGALVFDDGSTFALDRDYVIGRRPEKDQRVRSGHVQALTIVDPDSVLSGAHALISRQGDAVFLEDLGSLNGSHVAAPGATDWTRLEPHRTTRIEPGSRLLFGWTVATYSGPAE